MTEREELELEIDTWLDSHVQIIDGFKKELILKWSKIVANHFAIWQKEKLIEKSIPTVMQQDECGDLVPTLPDMSGFGFKEGDKVRVIIIKG